MLLQIHPTDPQPRLIKQVAESLKDGGVVIYPTDTIYGLGCDITQHRIGQRRGIVMKDFSPICTPPIRGGIIDIHTFDGKKLREAISSEGVDIGGIRHI